MDRAALIEALSSQIEEAERLKSKRYDCDDLSGWKAKTKSLIRKANEPDFFEQFKHLTFWSRMGVVGESDEKRVARNQPVYQAHLTRAQGILRGLIEILQIAGSEAAPKKKPRMGFPTENGS